MQTVGVLAFGAALTLAAACANAHAHGTVLATQSRLVATRHVDHVDLSTREPALLRHRSGRIFIAGYGRDDDGETQVVPRLWSSDDNGASWRRVDVGTAEQGALGNSDASLAQAPDGTLYYASLRFNRASQRERAWTGGGLSIGVSHDIGHSWHWTALSSNPHDDRPWIAVDNVGTVHVVWNDGEHIYYTASADAGASWAPPRSIHAGGGSSHMAIGPHGQIAVRIIPFGAAGSIYHGDANLVTVSSDGGNSWHEHAVPGVRYWLGEEASVPRWVEPLAWDAANNLFLLWTQVDGLHLGVSADEGKTWQSAMVERSSGDDLDYYPYLLAKGNGELAATWYLGSGDAVKWKVASMRVAHGHLVSTEFSEAITAEAWVPPTTPTFSRVRSSAGEYTGLAWGPGGSICVATPIQDADGHRFGFSYYQFESSARPGLSGH